MRSPEPDPKPKNKVFNVPPILLPGRELTDLELKYLVLFLGLAFLPAQLVLRKEQPQVKLTLSEVFTGHTVDEANAAVDFLGKCNLLIYDQEEKTVVISPHLMRNIIAAHERAQEQN